MPQETSPLDWIELVERFGVSFFILFFIGMCIWRAGQFFKPILKDYIERRIQAEEKRAEATAENARAASKNATMLAKSAEKSLEIQQENADTNRNLLRTLEILIAKIDRIAFPPPK